MRGWRRSIAINAIGAVTTGVVLVVVTLSKFIDGAWLSSTVIALRVPTFHAIRRHSRSVGEHLREGHVRPRDPVRSHVVIVVRARDEATAEALGYARAARPTSVRAVQPVRSGAVDAEERAAWRAFAGPGIDLETVAIPGDDLLAGVRDYVRGMAREPGDFVTVVVPEVIRGGLMSYVVRRRDLFRLKSGMLREPDVVVTDVPVVRSDRSAADARPLIPTRTVALVFISGVHDASMRAVSFARSLDAAETRAIYFDVDPELAHAIDREWFDSDAGIPLDIVEAPFRDLSGPILQEVRRCTSRRDTVVNVIVPEFLLSRWWQLPLHNQSALFVKRLLLFEERVILTAVPFSLRHREATAASVATVR